MGTIATPIDDPWLGSGGGCLGRRGRLALIRQLFNKKHCNFYTVWGYMMDNASPYGTNQRHPSMTQQSNGVGVRFLCGYDEWEVFIWGTNPNFHYFGASEMRWVTFHLLISILMVLFSMPGAKQQLTNRSVASKVGVYDAVWQWRVDMSNTSNMGSFFLTEMVPHIPSSEQQYWPCMTPCCLTEGKKHWQNNQLV